MLILKPSFCSSFESGGMYSIYIQIWSRIFFKGNSLFFELVAEVLIVPLMPLTHPLEEHLYDLPKLLLCKFFLPVLYCWLVYAGAHEKSSKLFKQLVKSVYCSFFCYYLYDSCLYICMYCS